jgi:xanthine dehydrogenase YagT iron-sulfur-binding subunit
VANRRAPSKGRRISRRAFLRDGAVTTAAVSTGLPTFVGDSTAQVREVVHRDLRRSSVELQVNGVPYRVEVANRTTLLQVLREELKLTGTKMGCDRAQCGACTVLLDGRPVYSCTTLAVEATGRSVLTIEGLARPERLHPIQQAFIDHSGFQCGFCTPGQILSAYALLERTPDPSEEQVRRALAGNLCRCAAYKRIVDSVLAAARALKS